jgi:hypothetical protein
MIRFLVLILFQQPWRHGLHPTPWYHCWLARHVQTRSAAFLQSVFSTAAEGTAVTATKEAVVQAFFDYD